MGISKIRNHFGTFKHHCGGMLELPAYQRARRYSEIELLTSVTALMTLDHYAC